MTEWWRPPKGFRDVEGWLTACREVDPKVPTMAEYQRMLVKECESVIAETYTLLEQHYGAYQGIAQARARIETGRLRRSVG